MRSLGNSSENFFRNSFPAWLAARIAAGSAALASLRTTSGILSDSHFLIVHLRHGSCRRGYAGSIQLDLLPLGSSVACCPLWGNKRCDASKHLYPCATQMSCGLHAALPRHERVGDEAEQGVTPGLRRGHRATSPSAAPPRCQRPRRAAGLSSRAAGCSACRSQPVRRARPRSWRGLCPSSAPGAS